LCTVLCCCSLASRAGHKKTNEEPKSKVLPLPRELPRAVSAETQLLTFHVTPFLKTGHLSAQVRDTITNLIRENRNNTIVKLRAYVAGAGDSRLIQSVVSDLFTDKKLALPVVSVIQVGALGDEAAAVVIEAVVAEHRPVNPNGLAFLAGQNGTSFPETLAKLSESLKTAEMTAGDVVSATCFAPRLNDYAAMRAAVTAAFPQAAVNVVQAMRDPSQMDTSCTAIARLPRPVPATHMAALQNSRVSLAVGSHIVLTGLQLSFGTYLDDADAALSHMAHDVEALHADIRHAVSVHAYSLNAAAVSALQKTMPKFNLPSSTLTVQPVEGLPSLDAALGMEAVLSPEQATVTTVQRLLALQRN
jgi:enamine deaminase RidA (YjgF/YER057c/UK114 family)